MKAKEILRQVVRMNVTDQQGILKCLSSNLFIETAFAGCEKFSFNGVIKDNTEYFYSYDDSLEGTPDGIIGMEEITIYLYEIEN